MERVIVAELGTNWDPLDWQHSLAMAMQEAKDAGANFVKCQDWFPLSEMHRPDEWKKRCKPWTLTPNHKRWLATEAARIGIGFFTSVFTLEALYWASNHRYPFIKIASSEAANDRLLRCVSGRVPTVVSFGETPSIERRTMTLTMLNTKGPVIACSCAALYPASYWDAASSFDFDFPYLIKLGISTGWSSHTEASDTIKLVPLLAYYDVGYFEFHFKSSATPPGTPDGGEWSLSPQDFASVVQAIRGVECPS